MFASMSRKELRSLSQSALAVCGVGLVVLGARGFMVDLRSAGRDGIDAATSIPAALNKKVELRAREQPLRVKPIPGLEDVVTEDQAFHALCACIPRWNPPKVAQLSHELRLWGPTASFADDSRSTPWSGAEAIRSLLSDKLCRERTSPNSGSYLLDSPFGIRVVIQRSADAVGTRGEAHHGQLLKVLAEVGSPLSTRVETESGRTGTIADILRDATMRFTLDGELEFMATALALWLSPERGWRDRFGVRHTFDDLVHKLLSQPYGKGACGGCHAPYALVNIVRCNEQYPILSTGSRGEVLEWLGRLSKLLERSERSAGGWDLSWPGTERSEIIFSDDVLERITVVGHHLEWIALAPSSVRPKDDVVQRAAIALTTDIKALPKVARQSWESLLPCSHAARALCLLRGRQPYALWNDRWEAAKTTAAAHHVGKEVSAIMP